MKYLKAYYSLNTPKRLPGEFFPVRVSLRQYFFVLF
jgi:hypothetical protein